MAKTDDEVRVVNDSVESRITVTGSVSDAGLRALRDNQRVQSLFMYDCPAGIEDGMHVLPTLSGLSTFSAGRTGLTDGGLVEVGKCERLRSLSLSGCKHITDAGLSKLENAGSISHLVLDANPQITGAGLATALERMPGLTGLVIRGFPLTAQEAAVVIRLPRLNRLEVDPWDTSEGANRLRVWWRNSPSKADWKPF